MKPPAGLWAVWVPVGGQAHAAPGAAPMLETRDATGMDTLLASQTCTARRNQVHLCPDDLGSPCPWDADSPACDAFRQERAHAGRCYLCDYLLCPSSVPVARVLRGHRVKAGCAPHRGGPTQEAVSSCCPAWRGSAVRRPPADAGAYRPDPAGESPAPSW